MALLISKYMSADPAFLMVFPKFRTRPPLTPNGFPISSFQLLHNIRDSGSLFFVYSQLRLKKGYLSLLGARGDEGRGTEAICDPIGFAPRHF